MTLARQEVLQPANISHGILMEFPLHRQPHYARGQEHGRVLLGGESGASPHSHSLKGDYSSLAYHFLDVLVGSPPQTLSVIVDTGSSLLAFPCSDCASCAGQHRRFSPGNSSTSEAVKCAASLEGGGGGGGPGGGLSPDTSTPPYCASCGAFGECRYSRSFSEGSAMGGRFLRDLVALEGSAPVRMQFGCHTRESGLFMTQEVDGILGLSGGPMSLPTALREGGMMGELLEEGGEDAEAPPPLPFSLCQTLEGGVLNFGAWDRRRHTHPSATTPLVLTPGGLYTVELDGVRVGVGGEVGVKEWLSPSTFASSPPFSPYPWIESNPPTVYVDSGSSYTYLPRSVVRRVIDLVERECWGESVGVGVGGGNPKNKREGVCNGTQIPPSSLPPGQVLCARVTSPQDVATFPSLTLRFKGGGLWTIPPSNLFLITPWSLGYACMQLFPSDEAGGRTVLGSNAMLGYDVGFLFTEVGGGVHKLGWARSEDCSIRGGVGREHPPMLISPKRPTKVSSFSSMFLNTARSTSTTTIMPTNKGEEGSSKPFHALFLAFLPLLGLILLWGLRKVWARLWRRGGKYSKGGGISSIPTFY